MDELTLLRDLRSEVPAPTERELAVGRADLLSAIETRRRPRRLRRIALVTAGVAAVVAAATIVGVIAAPGTPLGASPAAAAVLTEAAITTSDPAVPPGSYLAIETHSVSIAQSGPAQNLATGKEVPLTSWTVIQDGTLYVPADPDDVWAWRRAVPQYTGPYYGPGARKVAEIASDGTDRSGVFGLLHAAKGDFYPTRSGDGPWLAGQSPQDLAKLPRDPQKLLDGIERGNGDSGQSRGQMAFEKIGELLQGGLTTADLRAALYRAAALIPGVTLVDRATTLDGRTGVALGRLEPKTGIRSELIIDPKNGEVIGTREIATTAKAADPRPTGSVLQSTAIVRTVVATAP